MATTGTYTFGNSNFGPSLGGLGAYALRRVGVPRTSITVEHLEDVGLAANLVLSQWSNDQPNLWSVSLNQFPLEQGVATYTLPANVLLPLDFYLRTGGTGGTTPPPSTGQLTFLTDENGNLILTVEGQPIVTGTTGGAVPPSSTTTFLRDENGNLILTVEGQPIVTDTTAAPTPTPTTGGQQNDRIIFTVSRTEYASYPNKTLQQPPTVVWVNRVQPVQVSLYPTPDGRPYTLFYYAVIQDTDAELANAAALDLPYRAFKAFSDALVAELSLTYKPDQAQAFAQVALGSKTMLNMQDREIVPVFITPSLSRYYRT